MEASMEQEESTIAQNGPIPVMDENFWKAHVLGAQEFDGSEPEYCDQNGLNFSRFRKYKRKFGMTAPRGRPRKAFVRVETSPEPALEKHTTRSTRSREFRGLPDPRWMAEFVTALLDPQ
jgi:hypothetical protein